MSSSCRPPAHDGLPKGWPGAFEGDLPRVEGAVSCEDDRSQTLLGCCAIGALQVQKSFVEIKKRGADLGGPFFAPIRASEHTDGVVDAFGHNVPACHRRYVWAMCANLAEPRPFSPFTMNVANG